MKKTADKGGISTARLLWTYSRLYRYLGDESLITYMDHLYDFMIKYIVDDVHGGIYWMVDYKGNPTDRRKHVYAQAFTVYALSEYFLATGKKDSLEQSMKLFQLIESVGFDPLHKGYLEEFTEDWKLKDNEMLSENGVIAYFTMNTHLHVLEAYISLYIASNNQSVRKALYDLVQTFKNRFYNHEQGSLNVFFDENWESIIDMNSYGHDIEALWLIHDAMVVLELDDPELKSMLITIGENIFDRAIQKDGSIINEIEKAVVDNTHVWWAQSEAMVGFMTLFGLTGKDSYLEVVKKLWDYIVSNFIDVREGSEWFWSVDNEGNPVERSIVEPWKTPYHNVRGCIEVIERTETYLNKKTE